MPMEDKETTLGDRKPLLSNYPSEISIQMNPRVNRWHSGQPRGVVGPIFCCMLSSGMRKSRCLLVLLFSCLSSLLVFGYFYTGELGFWRQAAVDAKCFPFNSSPSSACINKPTTGPADTISLQPQNNSKHLARKNKKHSSNVGNQYNIKDELTNRLIRLNQKPDAGGSGVNFADFESIVKEPLDKRFDFKGDDVMVYLHIQKTGGTTFERHLVEDIELDEPCQSVGAFGNPRKNRKKKRRKKKKNQLYSCLRPGSSESSWLFSRYSTGWKCGLHADWTELTECVDSYLDASEGVANRKYFYMTFLREPVARYISEFLHVQRGATWKDSQYMCGGQPGLPFIKPCYETETWEGVTLDDFSRCESNMAFNRQTRMLSNLRKVNCYNTTVPGVVERESSMLASAKENLRNMAFFGITAQQSKSQTLFEKTFGLKFQSNFEDLAEDQNSVSFMPDLSQAELERVKSLNRLDIELYQYAEKLLEQRFRTLMTAGGTNGQR